MAYRIDPTRSAAVEVRRILGEQLDGAADELRRPDGPDAAAIHQARKHIKKARSLLRLARPGLGPQLVRHIQAELRQVAGDLAGARDADSLVEAADGLSGATVDQDEQAAVASLRSVLAHRADAARGAFTGDRSTVSAATLTLRRTAGWLRRVPPRVDGWEAIGDGLRRQYEQGCGALAALGEQPDMDELHDWRKRVKDLWYHERLLAQLWPEVVRPMASGAEDLAGALGTDHDLGLLRGLLGGDVDLDLDGGDDARRLALAVIDRERSRLQAEARRLGRRLYADTPQAWARRHRAWWEATIEQAAADQAGVEDPAEAGGTA
ncbi:MAG: CHAD domain-containing protein [Acidimicrobiales bacterium]